MAFELNHKFYTNTSEIATQTFLFVALKYPGFSSSKS